MVSNLTEIGNAISNLNTTFDNLTIENVLPVAIEQTNNNTNGWAGILVLSVLCFGAFLTIFRDKNKFQLFEKLGVIFFSFTVFIDIGIYLLIFGILDSIHLFIFGYTVFIVISLVSLLRKEFPSPET